MAKRKKTKNTEVINLENSLKQSGKVAYIYSNSNDKEFKKLIDEKIQYIWNYIYNIDNIVNNEEIIKKDLKEKLDKKKSLTLIDECDEIIFYNRNMQKLINIEKVKKALFYFNININIEDIVKMFLYYTDNEYFKRIISNNIFVKNIIETKKQQKKFEAININNLYIDFNTFKFIFLNLDFSIERGGLIW